jgi:hypothetical protein
MMPSIVSTDRILLAASARKAIRKFSLMPMYHQLQS